MAGKAKNKKEEAEKESKVVEDVEETDAATEAAEEEEAESEIAEVEESEPKAAAGADKEIEEVAEVTEEDQPGTAEEFIALATQQLTKGQPEAARQYYEQAQAPFENDKDKAGQANCLEGIGITHLQQGAYDRAGMEDILRQVGLLYRLRGDRQQAQEYKRQAAQLSQESE